MDIERIGNEQKNAQAESKSESATEPERAVILKEREKAIHEEVKDLRQPKPIPQTDPEYERQNWERIRLLGDLRHGELAALTIQNLLEEAEQLANPKIVTQRVQKIVHTLIFWIIVTPIVLGVVLLIINNIVEIDDYIFLLLLMTYVYGCLFYFVYRIITGIMIRRVKKKNAPLLQERLKKAATMIVAYEDCLNLLPENLRLQPDAYRIVRSYISEKGARNVDEALTMMGQNL